MKLTKHMQSCVAIETEGVKIVIDPGVYDHKVERVINGTNAVLITHNHQDHFDADAVKKALEDNPELRLYAPASVTEQLGSFGGRVAAVSPGDELAVGSVPVKVVGSGQHAEIHSSLPVAENVGFIIAGSLYHPGDSFDEPGEPVDTLLLPTSGPWQKVGESADFASRVKPNRMIAIHDAHNSDYGDDFANDQLGPNGLTGIELTQLKPGKSIDLSKK